MSTKYLLQLKKYNTKVKRKKSRENPNKERKDTEGEGSIMWLKEQQQAMVLIVMASALI